MNGFEAGPWDNKRKADGAHVFSKSRKLMYGDEHDKHGEEQQLYQVEVEKHKLHAFWMKQTLKHMAGLVARATAAKEPFAKITKIAARRGPGNAWPEPLGKHHALIEEMLKLGVVTVHQDESGVGFAKVVAGRLRAVTDKYAAADAATATADAASAASAAGALAASSAESPTAYFLPTEGFTGARRGYVFRAGDEGVGYYLDGAKSRAEHEAAAAAAAAVLPDGWVAGTSPEGYAYFFHTPTGSSSWERPTGPPPSKREVPLTAALAAALGGARNAAMAKMQADSGATVRLESVGPNGGIAVVGGTEAQVARACELLQRKADAVRFANANALPSGAEHPRAVAPPAPDTAAADYSFASVAGFVADADAAKRTLQALGGGSGAALAALGGYGDSDDDDSDGE